MKIETEIKIILKDIDIDSLVIKIEHEYGLIKTKLFNQKTYQFFLEDYTKQVAFPRIRNEENGTHTFTLKAKIKGEENSEFFKRVELETEISNTESMVEMMHYFGFVKKIIWEKRRANFVNKNTTSKSGQDFVLSLDETPMGYLLEVEAEENKIEEIIKFLELSHLERSNKSYLGLWEEYRKQNNITNENMLF